MFKECTVQLLQASAWGGKSEHTAPDLRIGKSNVVGNAHLAQAKRCEQRRQCRNARLPLGRVV
jgi:hypothetical protein